MMKKKYVLMMAAALLMFGSSLPASAALVEHGTVTYEGMERRLIYDTDLNVTWLDFSNAPGNYVTQASWADNLAITINGQTYDDWRLPATPPVSQIVGYNVIGSDLGHLYYFELGNLAGALANTGVFQNLLPVWYTSGTESGSNIWHFGFFDGWNTYGTKNYSSYYGIAVHEGEITAAPIPGAVWLLGSSLLGIIGIKRKVKK